MKMCKKDKIENHYVSSDELDKQAEIFLSTCRYTETGKYIAGSGTVTPEFGVMILKVSNNLASKSNFNQYTYKEDFVMDGFLKVLMYFHSYKKDKGSVFNYITLICSHAFITYIEKQKKQSHIKDVCCKNKDIFDDDGSYSQKSLDYSILGLNKQDNIILTE